MRWCRGEVKTTVITHETDKSMDGHLVADLLVVDLLELKARDPDALDTHVLEETSPLTTKSLKRSHHHYNHGIR